MEDFGKRLKEERERLGLSQAKFAEECGVGKTAQYTYEKGTRHPGSLYLDAAEKLGVDTVYVMTGTRKGKDWAYARAFSAFIYTVEMLLGLEEGRVEPLCKLRVDLDAQVDWFGDDPEKKPASGMVSFEPWSEGVLAWLATASKPDRCIDASLLARLVEAVGGATAKVGADLPTEKRIRAALMLYRDAKATGRVDQQLVDDAIKLAT